MSSMEYHVGKLRLVSKKGETLDETCKRLINSTSLNDYVEIIRDIHYNKYVIHDELVYEIYDHQEIDEEDFTITPLNNGTYSFRGGFYNGGCDLVECIGYGLDELLK